MREKLTALHVTKTSPPPAGRVEIFDTETRGLMLRVTAKGHRSFAVKARVRGQSQPRTVTIGPAAEISLGAIPITVCGGCER